MKAKFLATCIFFIGISANAQSDWSQEQRDFVSSLPPIVLHPDDTRYFLTDCEPGELLVETEKEVSFLFTNEIRRRTLSVSWLVSSSKCNAQPVGFRHGTNIQAPVSRGARLDHG